MVVPRNLNEGGKIGELFPEVNSYLYCLEHIQLQVIFLLHQATDMQILITVPFESSDQSFKFLKLVDDTSH